MPNFITVFQQVGPWVAAACIVAALVLLLATMRRRPWTVVYRGTAIVQETNPIIEYSSTESVAVILERQDTTGKERAFSITASGSRKRISPEWVRTHLPGASSA